jgi:signal transduction histidine kinase
MSHSSHLDAAPSDATSPSQVPPDADRTRRRAGSVLALRNWRLAVRLTVLVAIPTVLGMTLAGLRIADAARSSEVYGQVSHLAVLSQQVNGLAQAMEDERTATAAFIASGRPAAGRALLNRQYVTTDRRAAAVRQSVLGLGGYSAQTRSSAAAILAGIADLPGLRTRARSQSSVLTVIDGYSAAISGMFGVNDSIAGLSSNLALIVSEHTLGALARMEDDAALQQAILTGALAADHFEPGALTALASATARQASDLALFRSTATPEQRWALSKTMAEPPAAQARAVERRATAAGAGRLVLGGGTRQQWAPGMSYTVGWLRHAKGQLASWVASFAQGLHRNALRSALVTGALALAALLLVLLATMIIARSVLLPLRRLEAAALHVATTGLPAAVSALGAAGNAGHRGPLGPADVRPADEVGKVARAVDRVHRHALRMASDEARLRGSLNTVFVSFLRRSSSLLEPMLRQIDRLELGEDDPERLAGLFEVDQLATRLRRNTDSALVLTGDQPPPRGTEPMTLLDLLRAALSETEQYGRVVLDVEPAVSIAASTSLAARTAVDIAHLLAELLENATTFSPAASQVSMSGSTTADGGWLVRITDRGQGIPAAQLGQLNELLSRPPLADAAVATHLGLFAVAHLAARHGARVELTQPPGGGTAVDVCIPATLISPSARPAGPPVVLEPGPAAAPDTATRAAVPLIGAPSVGAPLLAAPLPPDPPAPAPDLSAQVAQTRLTTFQRGSRRARAVARAKREAED